MTLVWFEQKFISFEKSEQKPITFEKFELMCNAFENVQETFITFAKSEQICATLTNLSKCLFYLLSLRKYPSHFHNIFGRYRIHVCLI